MLKPLPTTGCRWDIYANLGYRGKFVEETNRISGFMPTLPDNHPNDNHPNDKHPNDKHPNDKHPNDKQGVPRRYKDKLKRELREIEKRTVERTFSWFNHYRRLSKDYERKPENSTAMIYLARTQLLLRRWETKCSQT